MSAICCVAKETLGADEAMDAKLRVGLDKYVDVVWHYFYLKQAYIALFANFGSNLLGSLIDPVNQHLASILGAPDNMEFAVESNVTIAAHSTGRLISPMAKARGITARFANQTVGRKNHEATSQPQHSPTRICW